MWPCCWTVEPCGHVVEPFAWHKAWCDSGTRVCYIATFRSLTSLDVCKGCNSVSTMWLIPFRASGSQKSPEQVEAALYEKTANKIKASSLFTFYQRTCKRGVFRQAHRWPPSIAYIVHVISVVLGKWLVWFVGVIFGTVGLREWAVECVF